MKNQDNTLTLVTCAYLYHWSHSFSRSFYRHAEDAREIQGVLQTVKEDNCYNYFIEDDDMYVVISGLKIYVNELMLRSIQGEYSRRDFINNRVIKDLSDFYDNNQKNFRNFYASKDNQCFYGKQIKSLEVEAMYDLNYYRMHFKRNVVCFVVSRGEIYEINCNRYEKRTPRDIAHRLQASSGKSIDLILHLLEFLTK